MTLTRHQFETACKGYLEKYNSCHDGSSLSLIGYPTGWTWEEHPSFPGLGYLSRSALFPGGRRTGHEPSELEGIDEDETGLDVVDDCAAPPEVSGLVTAKQFVVYSPTYQVPALYFTLHDTNGSPLTLEDITHLAMLRPQTLQGTESSAFALNVQGSSFAMLSQGEHPTTGTPCWYFHPCHTSEIVGQIMKEVEQDDWSDISRAIRWLEAWFMVLGNMIDFGVAHK